METNSELMRRVEAAEARVSEVEAEFSFIMEQNDELAARLAVLEKQQSIEESICAFVTKHYSRYQGAFLCGKCAEITCYLLNMAGRPSEKMTCVINGIGHILVKSGGCFIDPAIKQFGDYPEFSINCYPIEGVDFKPVALLLTDEKADNLNAKGGFYGLPL